MAIAERRAEVEWNGDLAHGNGTVDMASGAAGDLAVTWASRTERSEGKTSPEELIAAAHASCYAMALSHTLAQQGNPPTSLHVTATCAFDSDAVKITSVDLAVRGRVPGLNQSAFENVASQADQGCPVSNALRNNVDIHLHAQLEQS